jgi:predicted PhzF superfamily epimerase YddE/YHI9
MDLRDHFGLDQVQVDAFTAGALFTGNPAAVVFTHKEEQWMQHVAMENNLAETAFLYEVAPNEYKLRW